MRRSHISSRREFLAGAATTAAAAGLSVFAGCTTSWAQGVLPADQPYQPSTEPLQLGKLAGNKGILYGAMVTPLRLPWAPARWATEPYSQLIKRQCSIITNATMHFDLVEPASGQFDFSVPDRIAEYAAGNGLRMRGHALCWYAHFPKWMAEMDRATAIQAMENHIGVVVARYAGKVHSWDVVNEALNPSDKAPNAMRISGFTKTIGWDWMDFAFRAARRADPHALLTYNEYRIEVTHYGDSDARRAGMLNLLDDFRRRDIPIDAVGIQSHIDYGSWKYFDATAYASFLKEIAARGVKIFLTELDVIDVGSPTDPAERDRSIADVYRTYLSVALDNPTVDVVVDWGLFDTEAWQNSPSASASNPYFRRADGTPGRGLPFDSDMRPKLAAEAIAKVFEDTNQR
ncbi:MAG: endo-1,4-beta-xylanase [Candidatus Acidiferrales bacterium]